MSIHPASIISPQASLGNDVTVGPFCVIESGVQIGDGCRIASNVVIKTGVTLGKRVMVSEATVLGGLPQHLQVIKNPGTVEIGEDTVVREHVTVHRAMKTEGVTRVGANCLLMAGAHVAHDCVVGNHVVLTNNVLLGGHVEIGERAYLGGAVAVHQFCRIGRLAMVGGLARIAQDVPPFVMIDGASAMVVGLNRIGLRRAGVLVDEVVQLKEAYRQIYRSGLSWVPMLETLQKSFPEGLAAEFVPFFKAGKRGFLQERRTPPGAIVRLVRDETDQNNKSQNDSGQEAA